MDNFDAYRIFGAYSESLPGDEAIELLLEAARASDHEDNPDFKQMLDNLREARLMLRRIAQSTRATAIDKARWCIEAEDAR